MACRAPARRSLVLLENCRFNPGEKKDDDALARKMARLCDVYVNDAFGTAHRAEATTHGIARHAPVACAGPLLAAELDALGKALANPARPLVAIVGGSKVSTKLTVLKALAAKVDALIVGGGIANTFILAVHGHVGKSLVEADLVGEAQAIMDSVPGQGSHSGRRRLREGVLRDGDAHAQGDRGPRGGRHDPGPRPELRRRAEDDRRQGGHDRLERSDRRLRVRRLRRRHPALADAIAASSAFSIAGGGDTVAAIHKFGIADRISYISTAGGAFLEFLEGKTLPAVAILEARAAS